LATSQPVARRRAERPNRQAVIEAAAVIVDRGGWEAISLAAIAAEMGIHPTSLYTHVDGLDDVRDQLVILTMRQLGEQVWKAAVGRTGADALMAIGYATRGFLLDHPARGHAMLTHRATSDDAERAETGRWLAEPTLATMRSFGLDERQASDAQWTFYAAARGHVIYELLQIRSDPEEANRTFAALLAMFATVLAAGQWPATIEPERRAGV
jgi:AcrR family transcriptional regulator